MLHWSQEASTGWTRNSWGCSMAKRACLSLVDRTRARTGDRPERRRVGIYHRTRPHVHATTPPSARCTWTASRGSGRAAAATASARVDARHRSQLRWPDDGAPDAKEHEPRDAGSVTRERIQFPGARSRPRGGLRRRPGRAHPCSAALPAEVRVTVAHDAIPRRATDPGRRRLRRGRPGTGARRARRPAPGRRRDAGRRRRSSNDRSVRRADGRRPSIAARSRSARPGDPPITRRITAPASAAGIPPDGSWSLARWPLPISAVRTRSSARSTQRGRDRDSRCHDPGDRARLRDDGGDGRDRRPRLLDRPTPIDGPRSRPNGCADERRIADERCELATRARSHGRRGARRPAPRPADLRRARGRGRHGRLARRPAGGPRSEGGRPGWLPRGCRRRRRRPTLLEDAARDWLTEINRINTEAREAPTTATREHAAAARSERTLERLGLEADAARIGAENADAACLAARVAVAECDERASARCRVPGARIAPVDRRPRAARRRRDARPGARGRRRRRGSSGSCAATARR